MTRAHATARRSLVTHRRHARDSSPTCQSVLGPDRARAEPLELALYARDAGVGAGRAAVGVLPARRATRSPPRCAIAARHDRPFVARGSGTGLAGGATPVDDPLVIVTTRLNRMLEVDADERVAWVEPGVLNLDLSRAVAHLGLHYAPDPSSQQACTIGGNVATNAGGPHCLASGVTATHVLAVEVVLRRRLASRCSAASSPTSPGYDLRGLLRRLRGHDGHRHPDRGAAHAEPAGRAHAAARLHVDRGRRRHRERDHRRRHRARGARDDGRRRSRARSRTTSAPAIPRDAAAVLLVELDGLARRRRPRRSTRSSRGRPRARRPHGAGRRRRRRAGAALEGAQVGVRRHRPHRARLLPARRGGAAHEARRRAAPGVRDRRRAAAHDDERVPRRRRQPPPADRVRPARARRAGSACTAAGDEILAACVAAGGVLSGEHGIGLEKREAMPLVFSADDLDAQARLRDAFDPVRRAPTRRRSCRRAAAAASSSACPRARGSDRRSSTRTPTSSRGRSRHATRSSRSARGTHGRSAAAGAPARRRGARARGVVVYDPADLTVTVGAGTAVRRARRGARAEPARSARSTRAIADATVGGVARRRALRSSPPPATARCATAVLEVRFVTADGRLVKGGGPTVKNVSGFDLPRLLVGSLGTHRRARAGDAAVPAAPAGVEWFTTDADPVRRAAPRRTGRRAIAWDGGTHARAARGRRRRRRRRARAAGRRAGRAPRRPACPTGAHRGRISVRTGRRSRALAAALDDAGVRWLAEVGVGTVHVAADDASARWRAARARPRRGTAAGCSARRGAPGLDGFGVAPLRTRALHAAHPRRVRPRRASSPPGRLPRPSRSTHRHDAERRRRCMTLASTRTSWSRASRAGSACRTARRTASPGSRRVATRSHRRHARGRARRRADRRRVPRRDGECVQCRGCEAACPSGVPFGHLMEDTRAALDRRRRAAAASSARREWSRTASCCRGTGCCSRATWVAGVAAAPAPRAPAVRPAAALAASLRTPLTADAAIPTCYLFTGCVMDAWQRDIHRAALRVMRATGARVGLPGAAATAAARCTSTPAVGADAARLARRVIASMPGDAPVVVDSAGLRRGDEGLRPPARHRPRRGRSRRGSSTSRSGSRRTAAARARATRARRSWCRIRATCATSRRRTARCAPCSRAPTRCARPPTTACAAAPAARTRCASRSSRRRSATRKVAALRAARRDAAAPLVVVSANPGCAMHLRRPGSTVRHPAELLADATDPWSHRCVTPNRSSNACGRSRPTSATCAYDALRARGRGRRRRRRSPRRRGSCRPAAPSSGRSCALGGTPERRLTARAPSPCASVSTGPLRRAPPCARPISSSETSSTWLATLHRWPPRVDELAQAVAVELVLHLTA